jgi:predicted membrane-bound mannosyltransferase
MRYSFGPWLRLVLGAAFGGAATAVADAQILGVSDPTLLLIKALVGAVVSVATLLQKSPLDR